MLNVASDSNDCFLTARLTRARYGGASDMWLYRCLHHKSGFPQPVIICGRHFWRLSDLVAWERKAAEHPSKLLAPRRREGWQKLGDVAAEIVEQVDVTR